jgi:caffeoyl-CoA O-methyltransferase
MSLKTTPLTGEIEEYIDKTFVNENEILKHIRERAYKLNFPQISISPSQGRFLQLFLKSIGAKNVLEIGALFGYSAAVMAMALPEGGKVITCEMNPKYSDFIRKTMHDFGLSKKIEVINKHAVEFLENYKPDFEFDFVFIDADKENYPKYLDFAHRLLRKGGVVSADNALAFGHIAETKPTERVKEIKSVQKFNELLAKDGRFFSHLLQIGDGLALGVKL